MISIYPIYPPKSFTARVSLNRLSKATRLPEAQLEPKKVFFLAPQQSLLNAWARRLVLIIKLFLLILSIINLAAPYVASAETTAKSATNEPPQLILVSSHLDIFKVEIDQGFKEYRLSIGKTPVKLRWLDVGGSSEMLKFVRSEFERNPASAGIDLFYGGGTDALLQLESQNYLAAAPELATDLRDIPQDILGNRLFSPEFTWFSTSMSGFGIAYNKRVLDHYKLPSPKTWTDLTDPRAQSLVNVGDPRRSGSAHMIFEIILQAYGWDEGWKILYAIAANSRSFNSYSSQIIRDLCSGDVAYGLLVDTYGEEAIRLAGAENIGYLIPDGLSIITGDGIAMLKGAPNRDAAVDFMRYNLTEAAQRIMTFKVGTPGGPREAEIGKLSILPSLYQSSPQYFASATRPFELSSKFQYDSKLASSRWFILNDLFGVFLIDNQWKLQKQQRSLATIGNSIKTQVSTPVTEDYVTELVKSGKWRDQRFRADEVRRWQGMLDRSFEN